MSYAVSDIITWAKISQPLARYYEAKKKANGDNSANLNLDIELYDTRKDVEYAYAQDPTSANTYQQANYLLTLCGIYLFQAQQTTGGGGSITPITPSASPDPYDFVVSSSSFIVTGASSATLPSTWQGYNILLVRNSITQSTVNDGIVTCYSWSRTTRLLTFINGALNAGELIQIYPLI